MVYWYTDEGLNTLINEWKKAYPKATVYRIADSAHSQDPDVSQHAPDDGGSAPGDDKGEVDAADFMPGKGVTELALQSLFSNLHANRDRRVLYVIHKDKIFSSVVQPWKIRTYKGDYHSHVHVSINDDFDKNTSDWDWETMPQKKWPYEKQDDVSITPLKYGDDDDAFEGYEQVGRAQALLNWIKKGDDIDVDGVYGAYTAQKVKAVFGGTGKVLTVENIRKLKGI